MIVKKTHTDDNYAIFTDVADNIGYEFTTKKAPRIYCKNPNDGTFLLDENNEKIVLSDFPAIEKRFKHFVFDNNISGLESEDSDVEYDFIYSNDVMSNDLHMIRAETNTKKYKEFVNNCRLHNWVTLSSYSDEVEVTNAKTIEINNSNTYKYVEIGGLERGNYVLDNVLHGWDLPNRAKQSAEKYDIFVGKLQGCSNKFCMVLNDNTSDIVFTNGCYRVRISNERVRLSFYRFLYTKEYRYQMESLSTGSLLLDIKPDEFVNKIYFPLLSDEDLQKMREFIDQQEVFVNYRNEF